LHASRGPYCSSGLGAGGRRRHLHAQRGAPDCEMAANTREPLRKVAEQNAVGAVGAARPTKRHRLRERGAMLQALPHYPYCDASFLGPDSTPIPRDSVVRLHLIGSSPGLPIEIVLDRSPLIVGRNARSGADILLDDPDDRHLISQVSFDHSSAPQANYSTARDYLSAC
jgi:hypothetical protein